MTKKKPIHYSVCKCGKKYLQKKSPFCPSCRHARQLEMRRTYAERSYMKVKVQPVRGIRVHYPGCGCDDRIGKTEFLDHLASGRFMAGTEYWLDGKRFVVGEERKDGQRTVGS